MARNPTKIEIIQEGDERFMVMTFADGTEERTPIVKLLKKRYPDRPYWTGVSIRAERRGCDIPDRQLAHGCAV